MSEENLDIKKTKILERVAKSWVECDKDPIYFIEKFCMLKDQKNGRPIPFTLWPCQKEQLSLWMKNSRNITLKTRQIGISWLSAAYMLHEIMFKKYFEAMAISRKEADAIKYLDKARFMYNNLPELFKQMVPIVKENRLLMEFYNESVAMAESSNPDAGRSETLNMLILDEAAFIPDSPSIWNAAEPTLEKTNGKAIIISTGNGYDSFFQPMYQASQEEANGFKSYFISWFGDPERDQKWYDIREKNAKTNNRLREFRAEYPRNPVESFIVSGETFFDPDLIQFFLNKDPFPYQQGRLTEKGDAVLTLNSSGPLKVWDKPISGHHYVIGVDTAEGIQHGDNSVAEVYDRQTLEQVAEYASHTDTEEFAKIVRRLGMIYNRALINIEMNSVGESVLNSLVKQMHYPNIFRQMRYDEASNRKSHKMGWRTTISSKRLMLDALGSFLRSREMLPKSMMFFEEMKTFVMVRTEFGNYKLEASGNNHDDRVIATALCAIVLQEKPMPSPLKNPTKSYYLSRFKNPIRKSKQSPLNLLKILN